MQKVTKELVLSLALEHCPPEIINRLLDMGADINAPGFNNSTPLMSALQYSTEEIIIDFWTWVLM